MKSFSLLSIVGVVGMAASAGAQSHLPAAGAKTHAAALDTAGSSS